MTATAFDIIIILAALTGLVRGFRHGFVGQLALILGVAFGAVAAHLFIEQGQQAVLTVRSSLANHVGGTYAATLAGGMIIYFAVFGCFCLLSVLLRSATSLIHTGTVNALSGALARAFIRLVEVSAIMNIWVCVNPDSQLVRCVRADDGNLCHTVMLLAPEIMGAESVEEYVYKLQLRDARKISFFTPAHPTLTGPATLVNYGLAPEKHTYKYA